MRGRGVTPSSKLLTPMLCMYAACCDRGRDWQCACCWLNCSVVRRRHCCSWPIRSKSRCVVMSASRHSPSLQGRNEFCMRSGVAIGLSGSLWRARHRRQMQIVAGPTAFLKQRASAAAGVSPACKQTVQQTDGQPAGVGRLNTSYRGQSTCKQWAPALEGH